MPIPAAFDGAGSIRRHADDFAQEYSDVDGFKYFEISRAKLKIKLRCKMIDNKAMLALMRGISQRNNYSYFFDLLEQQFAAFSCRSSIPVIFNKIHISCRKLIMIFDILFYTIKNAECSYRRYRFRLIASATLSSQATQPCCAEPADVPQPWVTSLRS